jgi:uncharacterized protein YcbK (DUF882 family)
MGEARRLRLNDFKLAEHFNLIEFQCPCCHAVMLSPSLVRRLERLRLVWGRAIIVTSGYRCARHNREVGGAERSAHRYGRAADVAVARADQERFRALASAEGFGRVIVYPKRSFVHLEI